MRAMKGFSLPTTSGRGTRGSLEPAAPCFSRSSCKALNRSSTTVFWPDEGEFPTGWIDPLSQDGQGAADEYSFSLNDNALGSYDKT